VLKNSPFAFPDYSATFDLYAFSSDLVNGFSNAYYTTINRDPFEWAYDPDGDPADSVQNYVGSWLQNDALGAPVSGPRWRLRPNKFGQDLPGLEIPLIECSEPPFEKDNIKYNVGEQTITEINLLDWDEVVNGPSPLATTRGWVDVTQNTAVEVAQVVNGFDVTDNGLPMTDDFDLAVYIKGDKKPVALYDAQLVIDWDDQVTVLVDVPDVVGLTEAGAVAAITTAGLVANVTYASSDTIAAGLVISQLPAACTACVNTDSVVDIVVSTGPAAGTLDVANVVGMSEAAALAALDSQLVAVVNYANSDTVAAGLVISQLPAACTSCADSGDTVTLTVSLGPVADVSDVSISSVLIPANLRRTGIVKTLFVTVTNDAAAAGDGTGTVTLTGTDGSVFTGTFTNLVPGASQTFSWDWTVPPSQTVIWTIEVTVNSVVVDSATTQTVIR